jgi:cold shock CspA family protein
MTKGWCVHFSACKGYGKVRGRDHVEYFVHRDELVDVLTLRPGERVEFDPIDTERGPRAVSVRRLKP